MKWQQLNESELPQALLGDDEMLLWQVCEKPLEYIQHSTTLRFAQRNKHNSFEVMRSDIEQIVDGYYGNPID